MKRFLIACAALLALTAQATADSGLPTTEFNFEFRYDFDFGAAPRLCDRTTAWWADNLDADDHNPMPPPEKIEAALLECHFGCTTNLMTDETSCPVGRKEAGYGAKDPPRVTVTHGIDVKPLGVQVLPTTLPFGAGNQIDCGEPSRTFTADKLRLQMHWQCTVNGSVQSIRFWLQLPPEGREL